MLRSILVPLDGSQFGEHALPVAADLARRAGAALHLVHAHAPLVYIEGLSVLDDRADEQLREQERGYLERLAGRLADTGVAVHTAVVEGFAADVLREQAEAAGAGLIVMSTHGRGPFSRFWLGSVADALVRAAPVPLLLVRPSEQPAAGPAFRHVLIPLDGSALAEQAIQPAVEVGRLTGADYMLIRVVPPVFRVDDGRGEVWEATERQEEEAKQYLDRVAARLRGEGLAVSTRVVTGQQPADAILRAASSTDLIALATHGRRGLGRLVLGSVADKLIRAATVPVLVHRPQAV
ncbi:MAG TPA: universal stress protein [Gemmataceae bacterium]|nr:universal stress protein [Gemmataceae bacterium]